MSNNNNTVSNRLTRWSHMTRYRRCIETQCRPPQADEDCCKGGGGGETRVGSDLTTPLSPVKLTWRQLWSWITARDSEEEPVMSLPLSTMKVHSGTHLPEQRQLPSAAHANFKTQSYAEGGKGESQVQLNMWLSAVLLGSSQRQEGLPSFHCMHRINRPLPEPAAPPPQEHHHHLYTGPAAPCRVRVRFCYACQWPRGAAHVCFAISRCCSLKQCVNPPSRIATG